MKKLLAIIMILSISSLDGCSRRRDSSKLDSTDKKEITQVPMSILDVEESKENIKKSTQDIDAEEEQKENTEINELKREIEECNKEIKEIQDTEKTILTFEQSTEVKYRTAYRMKKIEKIQKEIEQIEKIQQEREDKKLRKIAELKKAEKLEQERNNFILLFSKNTNIDGSHKEITRIIKDNMDDPSSYEYVDTKIEGDYFVTVRYRGKNQYGAITLYKIFVWMKPNGEISCFEMKNNLK